MFFWLFIISDEKEGKEAAAAAAAASTQKEEKSPTFEMAMAAVFAPPSLSFTAIGRARPWASRDVMWRGGEGRETTEKRREEMI